MVLGTDHSLVHTGINTLAIGLGLNPFSTSTTLHPSKVYTSTADFNTGNYTSVNADTYPGSLVLNKFTATPFPLLWVPISGRGTVARVHTGTGAILGEYLSAPDGRGRYARGSCVCGACMCTRKHGCATVNVLATTK